MSTGPTESEPQTAGSTTCPACGESVPRGAFCGMCGAHLSPQRGGWAGRWRLGSYAAAPSEHVLRLATVSSLFPHLPHRSRAAFRAGLAVLVVTLAVLALLRWQAPLVAVCALGLPLLFYIYVQECDVYDDRLPVRTLLLTALLGVGLGVGWALLTGPIAARSIYVAAGVELSAARVLREGLAIPLGSAVVMLLPAVLIRLLRPPARESLNGFLIGTLGAIGFTAASTLTRLAPQLTTGVVARPGPVRALLVEAGIQGVAVPVTAAAAGGVVGAGLWVIRRARTPHQHGGYRLAGPLPAVVVVLVLYAVLGLIDIALLAPELQLVLHLLVAAAAVLALRVILHAALLHEERQVHAGGVVLCPHCAHVVPGLVFCPNCGVAEAARPSRTAPNPDSTPGESPEPASQWPGYAAPAGSYTLPPVRRTSHTRLLLMLGAGLVVVGAVVALVSWFITPPPPPHFTCPPTCPRPPIGRPVPPGVQVRGASAADTRSAGPSRPVTTPPGQPVYSYHRFTPASGPAQGQFTVEYPGKAHPPPDGNGWSATFDDSEDSYQSELKLRGLPAGNETPRQIAEDIRNATFPGATIDFEIPNAMVGYQPGYGEVDDYHPQSSTASYTAGRVLVMVAVKNGFALTAVADGPGHEFSPKDSGHPDPSGLEWASALGLFANSFSWQGDPLR